MAVLKTLSMTTDSEVLEAVKAAKVLGFGVVLENCWQHDPDTDEDLLWWHLTLSAEPPEAESESEVVEE
jgi:hypothetical protein